MKGSYAQALSARTEEDLSRLAQHPLDNLSNNQDYSIA
jgi:hypothetical protein